MKTTRQLLTTWLVGVCFQVGVWGAITYNGLPNATMCDGSFNTSPGGMYGYSLAATDVDPVTNTFLLVVGKPWDASVYIYKGLVTYTNHTFSTAITPNQQGSSSTPNTTSALSASLHSTTFHTSSGFVIVQSSSTTATSAAASSSAGTSGPVNLADLVSKIVTVYTVSNVTYTELQRISDDNNGTYPNAGYSLFGFSVSITPDGKFLAIGMPGKCQNLACRDGNDCIHAYPFDGGFRIYRNNSGTFGVVVHNFNASVPLVSGANTNAQSGDIFLSNQLWADRLGSKVIFSQDPVGTFLFISASAGWDGAVIPQAPGEVAYGAANFPQSRTTSTDNLAIIIMKRDLVNNNYTFIQRINCTSPIPLGVTGPITAVTGTTMDTMMLAVRDRNPTANRSMAYSFPCVNIYKYNNVSNSFQIFATVNSSTNYRGKQYYYREEDLFGVGMGFSFYFDATFSLQAINVTNPQTNVTTLGAVVKRTLGTTVKYTLCVAAPREAEAIYVFEGCMNITAPSNTTSANSTNTATNSPGSTYGPSPRPSATTSSNTTTAASAPTSPILQFPSQNSNYTWTLSQALLNQYNTFRSYFGGTQLLTSDSRFLFAADAVSSNGRGSVHVYYRYNVSEGLYGYESVVQDPASNMALNGAPIIGQNLPLYYRVAMFMKLNDRYNTPTNQFLTDHYGVALAANSKILFVGAPAEGCVYTFPIPPYYYINRTVPAPQNQQNSQITAIAPTIAPGATFTQYYNISNVNYTTVTSSQAIMYSVIAGGVAMVVIGPLIWFLIRFIHKRKHMKQLNEMASKVANQNQSQTNID